MLQGAMMLLKWILATPKDTAAGPKMLKMGPPGPLQKEKVMVSGVKWVIGIVF